MKNPERKDTLSGNQTYALSKYPHLRSLHLTTCQFICRMFCVWPKCSSEDEDHKCPTFHYLMGHTYSVVKTQVLSLYLHFKINF